MNQHVARPGDCLGNRRSIQLSYGADTTTGPIRANSDQQPHTPPTPERTHDGGSSGAGPAAKLTARSGALARFLAKTRREIDGPIVNGVRCLRWTGAIQSRGYGSFSVGDGKTTGAHRWICEQARGPIPPGHEPDHLCRNHWCVELAHLEVVTRRVNTLRGNSPTAINARKTHCDHGHELSGANLFLKRGKRQCRECKRATDRATKARAYVLAQRPAFPLPSPSPSTGGART